MTRPEIRWERSRKGVRFLRRHPKVTLGIVIPNRDGSYSWLSRAHDQGNRPARYATADEAMNGLCAVLRVAA
jgi:hypothetical protein